MIVGPPTSVARRESQEFGVGWKILRQQNGSPARWHRYIGSTFGYLCLRKAKADIQTINLWAEAEALIYNREALPLHTGTGWVKSEDTSAGSAWKWRQPHLLRNRHLPSKTLEATGRSRILRLCPIL